MSGPLGQEIDRGSPPGPAPSSRLTLADIAETLVTHLASAAQDDIDLAEVCLMLALTDGAGAYGRPRTARDARVNTLWASLAKVAAKRPRGTAFQWPMPSLHDLQRHSHGPAPQPSLLKKYLDAAGIPVPPGGDQSSAALLAAMPKLVPPRLIKRIRVVQSSKTWRPGAVARALAARNLPPPPPTLFPETKMVGEYVSGHVQRTHLGYLVDILEECAFFRRHADLETRVAEATQEMEPSGPRVLPRGSSPRESSHHRWYDFEEDSDGDLGEEPPPRAADDDGPEPFYLDPLPYVRPALGKTTGIAAENVFQVYERAMEAMVADVAAAVGADDYDEMGKVEQLPGMPEPLKVYVSMVYDGCGRWRGYGGGTETAWTFRCAHPECGRMEKFGQEGFMRHWHRDHLRAAPGCKPPPARGASVVRCGHPSCAGCSQAFSFEGLRRHAEKAHCHVRENAAYSPLAVANAAAVGTVPDDPDESGFDTNGDDSDY